jgi:hypothetical protein
VRGGGSPPSPPQTATLLGFLCNNVAVVAHAGDSRIVVLRDDENEANGCRAITVTRDHSTSDEEELARIRIESDGIVTRRRLLPALSRDRILAEGLNMGVVSGRVRERVGGGALTAPLLRCARSGTL